MGQVLGNLTNAQVALPGGGAMTAPQAQNSIPSMPDPTSGLDAQPKSTPSTVKKPSFLEAMDTGPGGTANIMSPELSTKGKILTTLLSGAFGALAGAGQKTVGEGFQAGSELPWQQAHERQEAELGKAQIQNLPWQRMQTQANLAKTQADTQKAQAETAILPSKESLNQAREDALSNKKLPDLAELYAQSVQKGDMVGAEKYKQAIQAIQKPVSTRPDTPEQQFMDSPEESGKPLSQRLADYSRITQKPPAPEKPQRQMGVTPDRKVIEITPGMTLPEGTQTVGGEIKQNAGKQSAEDALSYATDYLASKKYTGAGDEALMEKYFELAKPSSGFRMTQPQIEMLTRAQDIMNSVVAKGKHLFSPEAPYFSPTLRQSIVDTMSQIQSSKGHSGAAKGVPSKPSGSAKPEIHYKIVNGQLVAQ